MLPNDPFSSFSLISFLSQYFLSFQEFCYIYPFLPIKLSVSFFLLFLSPLFRNFVLNPTLWGLREDFAVLQVTIFIDPFSPYFYDDHITDPGTYFKSEREEGEGGGKCSQTFESSKRRQEGKLSTLLFTFTSSESELDGRQESALHEITLLFFPLKQVYVNRMNVL